MFCLYFILSLCVVTYCQDTSANQEQSKYTPSADTDFCQCSGIKYKNKCFIALIGSNYWVDYDGGVAICESRGGHLANIYSQTHMDDVMKYLRKNRLHGAPLDFFRLGMKYDPKAHKLTLRDGSDAPAGLKWHPGYPHTVEADPVYASYTSVLLYVQSDKRVDQYLINTNPSFFRHHALCEKTIN